MRLFGAIFFLTLVVRTLMAAPHDEAPRDALVTPAQNSSSRPSVEQDSLRLAEPAPQSGDLSAPLDWERRPLRPRSPWSFGAHLGFWGGNLLEPDATQSDTLIGASAIWTSPTRKLWDFELVITSSRLLGLRAGRRWEIDFSTQYEPYMKLWVQQALEVGRFPAGLVDLRRWKAGGALGLADLFEIQRRLNFEAGLGWGLNGPGFYLQIGTAFEMP